MSDRQRIPVLVGEVRLADTCKLPSGGRIPGEEALLIALKRLSSSCSLVDFVLLFGRSSGYISEAANLMRTILHGIAAPLVDLHGCTRFAPTTRKALHSHARGQRQRHVEHDARWPRGQQAAQRKRGVLAGVGCGS